MLAEAWNALQDSLAVVDEAGIILVVNRAWEEFGAQNGLKEGLGGVGSNYLAVCDAVREENGGTARAAAEGIRGVLAGRLPVFELEYACHSPEEERWFLLRATRYVNEGRAHAIVMHENVTDRHYHAWERDVTAEYLQLINGCGGVKNLMEATARFFQRRSGCEAVGIRLKEGDDYPYFEARGFSDEFVRTENTLCVRSADGQAELDEGGNPVLSCMCGNVIAGRFDPSKPFFTPLGSFWTNCTTELLASTTEADRQARTRNRCNGEGYESVALVPLRLGRTMLGLLQLNDRRKNRFSPEKMALWERVAGYLTVALAHARTEEELESSRAILHAAIDSTSDVVFMKDLQGRYKLANRALCQLLGKKESEILGRSDSELFPREVAEEIKRTDRQILAGKAPDFVEVRIPTPTGWRVYLGVKTLLGSGDGKIKGIFGISQNITERKTAEEALKKSEAKFAKAFQACAEPIMIINLSNGHYVEVNEAFLRKTGLKREAVIGHTAAELGFWVNEEERRQYVDALRKDGFVKNFEQRFRMPEGTIRECLISSEIVELAGIRCSLSYVFDITERKHAEELLKVRESYLTSIIENQPGLIWLKDAEDRFLMVNKAFAVSCGLKSPEELVGKTDLDIWPRELAEIYQADDARVRKEKRSFIVEEPVFDQGQKKWFETFKTPIFDETGEVLGTTGYARDISERKAAEETLRRSQADLAKAQGMARIGNWRVVFREGGEQWRSSDELCRIWGYPVGTLLTMRTGMERMHPDDRARTAALWNAAMELGGPTEWEHRILVDGVVKWIHVRIEVERDEEGRPRIISATNQDITEAKAAEELLKQSEEKFAKAFRASPEAMTIVSMDDGRYIDVNDAFVKITGYRREEVVGNTAVKMGVWIDMEDRRRYLEELLRQGSIRGLEGRFRMRNGEIRDFLISSEMVVLEGRQCSLNFIYDVTDRKLAEDSLRRSERMLRESQEVAGLGSYELDMPTGMWRSSEVLDEVLGIGPEYFRSVEGWAGLVHPEDREDIVAYFQNEVVGAGKDFDLTYRIIRPSDGAERWVHGLGKVERNAEGRVMRMWGTIQDITERKASADALKASEARLAAALDGARLGSWEWDLITNELFLNATQYELLGLPAGDGKMAVSEFFVRVHPEDLEGLYAELEDTFRNKNEYHAEFRILRADREARWLFGAGRVIRDADGIPVKMIGINQDITERRRAEEALRESERQYRSLFDGMSEGFAVHEIILDEAGRAVDYRFLDVNAAFERLTGLKREVLVGRTVREVLPEDGRHWIESYGTVALTGNAVQFEQHSVTLDRHYSVLAYRPAAGQFATIFMDVTGRKKAEAEIQLLKQSIDLNSDGAYWFDTENRIVYVNEAACRAVGYTREELMGQHLSLVNPGATEARLTYVWEKLRESGRHVAETVHRRKDGTEFPVEISATRVWFGGKEYNCGFARDISERKKAEAEIGRHQSAVAHLARLNVMGQMATGLAHELNQPLTAIRNYAHYCRTLVEKGDNQEESLPEALGRIDQAVARASQIIQRMREFVRKEPPVRKETDLNKTIYKCLGLMEPALNRQRIWVERALAKHLPTVVVDEVQIEQVVVNLIQNAVDAMAETPVGARVIRVETGIENEWVMVAIADRGCGIAVETAARIFDEFFTTKKTGTGLGLSISKRIVENHGGRLTPRENPNGGTIFELVLPLKKGN